MKTRLMASFLVCACACAREPAFVQHGAGVIHLCAPASPAQPLDRGSAARSSCHQSAVVKVTIVESGIAEGVRTRDQAGRLTGAPTYHVVMNVDSASRETAKQFFEATMGQPIELNADGVLVANMVNFDPDPSKLELLRDSEREIANAIELITHGAR